MGFDFQKLKPVIQREFDEIMDRYPTDLGFITDQIPVGGNPYERKRIIVERMAAQCPVHVFDHYPFAFELDIGGLRNLCYIGIGCECYNRSGVDFRPLHEFRTFLRQNAIGSFNDYTDYFHRTIDHDKLFAEGFRGVYEECMRLNTGETDPAKRRWRELVMICCKCTESVGLRFREAAREKLKTAADEAVRRSLVRMIESVNTPWEPPETLFDALTCMMRAALLITGMEGVQMNACGQLDRLLEPFYERDIAAGRLTEEEAYFLIQCFLYKTDLHCHFNERRDGYDHGVTVAIGGCGPDGKPVYNRVTELIIRAYSENQLVNPKLNARASAESPREYIDALSKLILKGGNNIIVQNDDYIIPMFIRMGLSPEDARTYIGNGCQEVVCRNQQHSRAFTYISLPRILLDTLFMTREALPEGFVALYRRGRFEWDSFEALYDSFLRNLRSLIQEITETFRPYEAKHRLINPEPMLSAFTADCVASGRDQSDGGARYNHKTLSLVGFGTLCDSLLSLRSAYRDGTQDELIEATKNNFENADRLRSRIQTSANRFGHSEEADAFARRLAGDLAQVSRGITNAQGIEWRTSLFTYYEFHALGIHTGATPDGRKAYTPFSRQMNMASMPDLTSAALSMSALTEAEFNDVGMFDFVLPFDGLKNEQAADVLTDFIRTCIDMKLPVLQPNAFSVDRLVEERNHPGSHPDLIVRVCGYSAPFGRLNRAMQDEIILRAAP